MEPLKNAGRGAAMGLADLVPGISGGTIALLLGIHPRLVAAIAAFDTRLPIDAWLALRGDGEARARLARLDLGFLIPLGLGIVAVILAGAHLVEAALEAAPGVAMAVFFGLLAASIPIPLRHATRMRWTAFILGAAVAAALLFLPGSDGPTGPVAWLAVGSIALLAMLLPGVSGAGLLVILGAYEAAIHAVSELDFTILLPFLIGGVLGLALASRGLRWLFTNRPDPTWAFLAGLLAGSLVRVWPWRDASGFAEGMPALPVASSWYLVLVAAVAAVAVMALDRASPFQKGDKQPDESPGK